MKPTEYDAGHYLESDVQLKVPIYQRPYEWDTDRWVDLWRDVAHQYRQLSSKADLPSHYMGALILEKDISPAGSPVHSFWAIDGQQRLVTMFVLLAALRDHEAYLSKRTINKVNDLNTITPKYGSPCERLIVREQNRPEMQALLQGDFVDGITASLYGTQLAQAYRFFRWQLWLGADGMKSSRVSEPPKPKKGKAAPPIGGFADWPAAPSARKQLSVMDLHTVITKRMRLLELLLDGKSDEESSVIFETMNSKSTPLRQFDLVRNSIFVRMPNRRNAFYNSTWQPVERLLTSVSYTSLRAEPEEQFMYEHLISLGEDKLSRDALHRRWLTRVIDTVGYAVTKTSEKQFEEQIARPLATSAALYPLAVGQTSSVTLEGIVHKVTDAQHAVIREIMATTGGPAVPLILQVLEDSHGAAAAVSTADATSMLRDIQSFIIRMILAGETLSPLRATFMGVAAGLPRPLTLQSLRDGLQDAGWLSDKDVLSQVKTVSLKEVGSASYFPILRGIERHLAGAGAHPMPFGSGNLQYSVEHVYPQTENIGAAWTAELQQWQVQRDDMDERRHVLGNLTAVTGYDNKKNGKKPFTQKLALIVKVAPLRLHDSIISQTTWTPTVIDDRTTALAKAALSEWPAY